MSTVLIIRHAEKPDGAGNSGIDGTGKPDDKSLTPRGWQRAGVWAELFSPSLGHDSQLPKPTSIFASAPADQVDVAAGKGGSKSRRPLETIAPLAQKLRMRVDLSFEKGQEHQLAQTLAANQGVALVCWQHEDIGAIARALTNGMPALPTSWPGDRFNVVFQFDRTDSGSNWTFRQVVPVMLEGDPSTPID
jgi:hypothetical protein